MEKNQTREHRRVVSANEKKANRAARRSRVQDEARALLEGKPARDVSVEEISSKCGLSVGAIYLYFPSKDDLLVSLLPGCADLDSPVAEEALDALLGRGRAEISEETYDQVREVVRARWKDILRSYEHRLSQVLDA